MKHTEKYNTGKKLAWTCYNIHIMPLIMTQIKTKSNFIMKKKQTNKNAINICKIDIIQCISINLWPSILVDAFWDFFLIRQIL